MFLERFVSVSGNALFTFGNARFVLEIHFPFSEMHFSALEIHFSLFGIHFFDSGQFVSVCQVGNAHIVLGQSFSFLGNAFFVKASFRFSKVRYIGASS